MKFSESLKKNEDFKKVYKKKRSLANKYFVMYVSENGLSINRLGISVSKKVGNSVVRHRIARLVRESYRLNEEKFIQKKFVDESKSESNSGLDIVMVAREGAAEIRYSAVESALLHLAGLHKILTEY